MPWLWVLALLLELRNAIRILLTEYLYLCCLCLLGRLTKEAKCPKAITYRVSDQFRRWDEDDKPWNFHLLWSYRASDSSCLLPFDFYSKKWLCTLLHNASIWRRVLRCQAHPFRLAPVLWALTEWSRPWCLRICREVGHWYTMFRQWKWANKLRKNQKPILKDNRKRFIYL